MTTPRATTSSSSFLGSGMTRAAYFAVLFGAVLVFVFWGGPIWSAGPADSHLGRFAVSYGAIIPAVGLTLLLTRAYSTPRLITAVGTLWGIKLVITAALYFGFGPRGGMFGTPATAAQRRARRAAASTSSAGALGPQEDNNDASASRGYEAATGAFEAGGLAGKVMVDGAPQKSALIVLLSPQAGRKPAAAAQVSIAYDSDAGGFAEGPFVATSGSNLQLSNADGALRIVDVTTPTGAERAPVPPRGKAHLELVDSGLYRLRVAAEESAETALVVVDHPYWARSDEQGVFRIEKVPVGAIRVWALAGADGRLMVEKTVQVKANAVTEVELALRPVATTE
ncbi:MAG TPA: hypothetical protein ENK23_05510 [Sorangium sp.]|nr:hypothetical protein [Sorangium sp.]